MITAHIESLTDCLEELKPIFTPHYEALALDQDKVPLDPDYPYYLTRDAAGQVLCCTMRDRGQVVAYFVGFVHHHPHYRTCLTLTMDLFWLSPDYRDEDSLSRLETDMLASQLFDAVKKEALRRGVKRPFFGSKWHQDASRMFEEMGLQRADTYYSTWWGD